MLFSQMLLAAICVVLGIGSPVIAPVLGDVAQSVLAGSAITATSGVSLVNEISGAATSTPPRSPSRSWSSPASRSC